jgi:glucose-6-phosphate isomerase
LGWAVRPESEERAASTTSTPAAAASSTVAEAMAEVSWVWKWTGMRTSPLSAVKSLRAAMGFMSPAMSFTARKWAPMRSSSRASDT